MTDDTRERIDAAALDALIAQSARVEAPAGFAVRVQSALDARETAAGPGRWLRPALAVAAMLLLGVLWWALAPVTTKPDAPSAFAASPLRRDKPVARVAPGRTPPLLVAPVAPIAPITSAFAASPLPPPRLTALRRDKPVYVRIDHERAVDALDAVTAVQQKAIDPAVIATSAIDVQPADSIAPLNIDTNGPDPGGQGDH
jgi:hypothetical protein